MYEDYELIRNKRGYKDSDVATATGITKSTFSDWKSGRSNPKGEKLAKIAAFLDCSIEDLAPTKGGIYIKKADGTKVDITAPVNKAIDEAYYLDEEARELAEFVKANPEYKVLFDASRKVSKEDIAKALKALGIFTDED